MGCREYCLVISLCLNDKIMGSSWINLGAGFLRIFTVALDRLF